VRPHDKPKVDEAEAIDTAVTMRTSADITQAIDIGMCAGRRAGELLWHDCHQSRGDQMMPISVHHQKKGHGAMSLASVAKGVRLRHEKYSTS
jgi:hypothetical protein